MPFDAKQTCVAVLAAGSSYRFGETDKLTAQLGGKMLGLHICDTLSGADFAARWVIASKDDHPCQPGWTGAGFEVVVNEHAQGGMGTSVALAAQLASKSNANGLLICLADMPLVPLDHIGRLVTRGGNDSGNTLIASGDGKTAMPPALFGRSHWAELSLLDGEHGARELLSMAELMLAGSNILTDIDTPARLSEIDGLAAS